MSEQRRRAPAARGTLALTAATKLAGLATAVHELLLRQQLRPVAVAAAVFMMAGAQVSEPVLLALVEKFFSLPSAPRDDGQ